MLGEMMTVTIRAKADLSKRADLFRAISHSGDFAANGREAVGLLLSNGTSGQNVTVGVCGHSKFFAIAPVSYGSALTVSTSGSIIVAAAATHEVGMCLGADGADAVNPTSGALGAGFFNFAVKHYAAPGSGGAFI